MTVYFSSLGQIRSLVRDVETWEATDKPGVHMQSTLSSKFVLVKYFTIEKNFVFSGRRI